MELSRKTKRLIVRPMVDEDYPAWSLALSSLAPTKKNEWDLVKVQEAHLSESRFELILNSQNSEREDDHSYELGVFLPSGALVGVVSLMDVIRSTLQSASLGYRIYHPHWGKGYGKEATRAAIDIAFRDLKLHRVEAAISPQNKRSIQLAKGVGLKFEALSKKRIYVGGVWKDMELYTATTEDFGLQWQPLS